MKVLEASSPTKNFRLRAGSAESRTPAI